MTRPDAPGGGILGRHIRHRLLGVDTWTVRCVDCEHTLDLRQRSSAPGSTSTSPDPTPRQQCPQHPGEWQHACRGCAADAKGRKPTDPEPAPLHPAMTEHARDQLDVARGHARAALAGALSRRPAPPRVPTDRPTVEQRRAGTQHLEPQPTDQETSA